MVVRDLATPQTTVGYAGVDDINTIAPGTGQRCEDPRGGSTIKGRWSYRHMCGQSFEQAGYVVLTTRPTIVDAQVIGMSVETVVTAFPRPPPLKVSLTAGNFHHVILGAREERELGG